MKPQLNHASIWILISPFSFGFSMTVPILQPTTFPQNCNKSSLGEQSEGVSLRSFTWYQDMDIFSEHSKMAGKSAGFINEISRVADSRAFVV